MCRKYFLNLKRTLTNGSGVGGGAGIDVGSIVSVIGDIGTDPDDEIYNFHHDLNIII